MSIVCWDGKLLVCDRMGTCDGMRSEQGKSQRLDSVVLAWTGDIAMGLAMVEWFHCRLPAFPACQADNNRWCRLIVADKHKVVYYEQEPYPIPVLERFMAWGAGRDFAMGAFHMGANAKQAADAACRFSDSCGMGLDVFDLTTLSESYQKGGDSNGEIQQAQR